MPLSKPIRALVVDDEAPARKRLRDLLGKDGDVETVMEAENGVAAVATIETEHPDIVFLDVQMPGIDGFGVIEAIGVDQMPPTIFVTAYDRFAMKAFDADAIDYLMKPFSNKRYDLAVIRAKVRLSYADRNVLGPHVLDLVARRSLPGAIWDWLVIKNGGVTRFVRTSEIDWIEAAGVYVNLHVQGKELIYRASLGAVIKRLDPFQFVRIHRSSVVNIKAVAQMEAILHGDLEVILKDGTQLTLSRNYRADVERILGQSL
jgi:two-component system, LytTR family, response regulator